MARAVNPTQPQRDRDEALARARRLTWWAAIGATGITALAAAIAANTIPGHALGQSQPAASSSSTSNDSSGNGAAGPATGTDPGSLQQPTPPTVQQPPVNNGPVVVSGGS